MLARFYPKVKMCKVTHRQQTVSQTFIQFCLNFFLERHDLVCLFVSNTILFGIVVHIKLVFWICMIFMWLEWYCSICIKSKSDIWISCNPSYEHELWYYIDYFWLLFGRSSLLVSMWHFSAQVQRIILHLLVMGRLRVDMYWVFERFLRNNFVLWVQCVSFL